MYWNPLFLCFVVVLVAAEASNWPVKEPKFYSSGDLDNEWEAFKIKYGKTYKDADEEAVRKKIFAHHLEEIDVHNRQYKDGEKTFTLGINSISDLETSEVLEQMTGHIDSDPSETSGASNTFIPDVTASIPDEIDWVERGYVTPAKQQGSCGSCWAFSAIGALEGQHYRKSGKLVSLSQQQLVDCSNEKYRSYACRGGTKEGAFSYIASNGGIDTDESYPYEAVNGTCRYDPSTVGATCTGYMHVPKTEAALREAVGQIGPVAVGINASLPSFRHYEYGIFDEPSCSQKHNHAVLIVGYGSDSSGMEYWIVKNSWGPNWGNDGYIRMARNKGNQCGISNWAYYPVV